MMNIEEFKFTEAERITWHYVMDIHDPENYWYSKQDIENVWRNKK